MDNDYVFLMSLRDFHGLDWYKSAKYLHPDKKIEIVTAKKDDSTKLVNAAF